MKSPKNLKPLEKNPALIAATRVRKKNDAVHSVTLYVQSGITYAGKIRIVMFRGARKFGCSLRVDRRNKNADIGFVNFCTEISGAESYDAMLDALERHGFDTGAVR